MKLRPTPQQVQIVEAAKSGKPLKIKAFAGAAKTTTLEMISKELPHRCLYLAYNKKMQLEAKDRFPENVEVRTVHSMAYQFKGREMAHKLRRPSGAYQNVRGTASEIARAYKLWDIPLPNGKKIRGVSLGKAVRDTVNAFENSAHDAIGAQHVRIGTMRKFVLAGVVSNKRLADVILPAAKRLWAERCDMQSTTLASHETYLKLFQMSKPDLAGFQTIFLDEAQDSNDCVLDIVLSQTAQTIVVGDDFQSIYQWRGSTNALEKVNFPEFDLTTSFRFGQEAADIANLILGETEDVSITGNQNLQTRILTDFKDVPYPYTKIFRTNSELLIEAVDLLSEGIALHIEVDFNDLILSFRSAEALYMGRMKDVKHDLWVGFENWEEATFEGQTDGEVGRIVRMIEKGTYLRVIDVLVQYRPPENPEVRYITAHKSKGLEWDNVVIANDFPPAYNEEGNWALDDQERNLAYVAHTRVIKSLCVGSIVHEIRASAAKHRPEKSSHIEQLFEREIRKQMVVFGHRPWEDDHQLAEMALPSLREDLTDFHDGEMHLPK